MDLNMSNYSSNFEITSFSNLQCHKPHFAFRALCGYTPGDAHHIAQQTSKFSPTKQQCVKA